MTLDRSFVEHNRAATGRMADLAARLTDEQWRIPVGEHWNAAIALAHLAFWDLRVLAVLDRSEREGVLVAPEIDLVVNDLSLPLWGAIPPREAARIAVETAERLDSRLEACPPGLIEEMVARYPRWVVRALHRNEHLDEVDAALGG
jgi:hypothetical protein